MIWQSNLNLFFVYRSYTKTRGNYLEEYDNFWDSNDDSLLVKNILNSYLFMLILDNMLHFYVLKSSNTPKNKMPYPLSYEFSYATLYDVLH